MIELKSKRALILAPHTDDGELGCGGTIAKMIEEGAEVFYVAFSSCEQSVPDGYQKNILIEELHQAMSVLGVPKANIVVYNYPVRHFREHRQDILQDIIDRRSHFDPDVVFMPCLGDIHQDHQVIAEEGLRAYKGRTILSYELPWNNLTFNTSAFVKLDKRHVDRKAEALSKYETQKDRPYTNASFTNSLARTRGVQIDAELAEAFEVVRLVL